MKKIVISGGDESNNIGDASILASILTLLRKNINDADITVFANDPEKIALQFAVNTLYKGRKLFRRLCGLWREIRALYNTDLLIWGGGHLLQDKSSQLYIPFHLSKVFLAKVMGKRVAAYAIGVGPIDKQIGRVLTKYIVNKIDFISVRDKESKEVLKNVGVRRPIHVTVDPAILLSPINQERAKEILLEEKIIVDNNPLVGIAPRRWFHHRYGLVPVEYVVKHARWGPTQRIKYEKLKATIAYVADFLISKMNAKIIFVPMYTCVGQEDDKVAYEIIEKMEHKHDAKVINGSYTPQQVMGIFELMDLLIGMRMHSLILAAAVNIPIIGLNYSPKGTSFMQRIGQENFSFNIEDDISVDTNTIIEKIQLIFSIKGKIKEDLKIKVRELQEKALLNIHFILEMLEE